ncbi:MAG: glycosyltransferase family 2 protein [Chryseobacterium sp.]|jgi:GT2 family glycosyltransferase|uniref:glycosyltransferase family 2 protein n=1 Tax=Chryseobacterium sp. TaxID=1871047 RepID=UPI002821D175|nr:glycosyltransferase family 2 protein [Chryseobacterium sp.]MDR2236522.1 glycosyltransferase family 2 protein [Chryseobacterium sp.]
MINYVMLTWNRKTFVEEFFKSFYNNIGNQNFNFYIIDNGSTDGSVELLKEIGKKDARIKLAFNTENKGLGEYKLLFKKALKESKSDYIVIMDDDVIDFPENFDLKMMAALQEFKEVGYLSLDVVQDDKTNGAKPPKENYTEVVRNNIAIDFGPAGGWCAMVRTKDFRKINFFVGLRKLSMKSGEDGTIIWFLKRLLNKKSAVLKNIICLHATGPYYAKKFGFLERDIEKYNNSGLIELRDIYISYRDKEI